MVKKKEIPWLAEWASLSLHQISLVVNCANHLYFFFPVCFILWGFCCKEFMDTVPRCNVLQRQLIHLETRKQMVMLFSFPFSCFSWNVTMIRDFLLHIF